MNAQREAEVDNSVDDPLVEVNQRSPFDGWLTRGQLPNESLFLCDLFIPRIFDQPVDEADVRLQLRHEAERQQDLRPEVVFLRELAEKADYRIRLQQLSHRECGALVAFEREPTALAGTAK